eukprot:364378-Chlamydomonas_euryale.AAC.6
MRSSARRARRATPHPHSSSTPEDELLGLGGAVNVSLARAGAVKALLQGRVLSLKLRARAHTHEHVVAASDEVVMHEACMPTLHVRALQGLVLGQPKLCTCACTARVGEGAAQALYMCVHARVGVGAAQALHMCVHCKGWCRGSASSAHVLRLRARLSPCKPCSSSSSAPTDAVLCMHQGA